MDHTRYALVAAAERQGVSLLRLSRLLGRNDAYLQQFVRRGSPRVLPERERAILADYLGLDEVVLGAPAATRGIPVRRLVVTASAGPGALSDDDRFAAVEHFPAPLLHGLASDADALSLIVARGDSMLPTIADGDDILVDISDRRVGARPAIFVLRLDDALVVKRLWRAGDLLHIASDNRATPPIAPIPLAGAEIVGRVVWLGRRLS